jgi:hypothetical protein
VGLRAAFRDYLHADFDAHINAVKYSSGFKGKLSVGDLKPFIPNFVQVGIAAIKNPEMRVSILRTFAEVGLFEIMRHPVRIAAARAELLLEDPDIFNALNLNGEEPNQEVEELEL